MIERKKEKKNQSIFCTNIFSPSIKSASISCISLISFLLFAFFATLKIDRIVRGHRRIIWTVQCQPVHRRRQFYPTKRIWSSTKDCTHQPPNQCTPIDWFTRNHRICCNMRIIRLIGIRGVMRQLKRPKPKIKWSFYPSDIRRAIGVMSWKPNHLKIPR